MIIFLQAIFLVLATLLALPVAILCLQVAVSLPGYKNKAITVDNRPSVVVLIPAHNESRGLLPTIQSVKAQLVEGDRIFVIADNCTDDTAQVATASGVEVLERFDELRRGKSYALDFGVRFLEQCPAQPDVVIVIDADCLLGENAISRLAYESALRKCPIQSLYLMHAPADAGLKAQVAEFAWLVKNWVRPLGFLRLGLPCQLMGTGMAFPWHSLQQAEIASGHIVEDLKLGLAFANMNRAPQLCPEARVTSVFPSSEDGVKTQRTRWEHGHLSVIAKDAPRLFWQGITSMNLDMLVLVLDMCVPPLALLTLSVTALSGLSIFAMLFAQQLMPWFSALLIFAVLGVSILLAWAKFGRHILSFSSLAYAPIYAVQKVPLYLSFIAKRQVEWVRSRRD